MLTPRMGLSPQAKPEARAATATAKRRRASIVPRASGCKDYMFKHPTVTIGA
jgi:hypothetical protein